MVKCILEKLSRIVSNFKLADNQEACNIDDMPTRKKKLTEQKYTVSVTFPKDITYEERESILRRALYKEEEAVKKHGYKTFKYIIAEKTMKGATVNFLIR